MHEAEPQPTYDAPLERCPLCAGDLAHGWDMDFRGHRIDRCRRCDVRFMNPRYSDAWLHAFYGAYEASGSKPGERTRWRARPEVRRAGKERALELIAAYRPVGTILLVGCGDGLEIEIARAKGWTVQGLEVDAAVAERLRACYAVPIAAASAEHWQWPPAAFDAIYADQVLEHMKDPLRFLTAAAAALRPGGVLFVAVPNIGSLANAAKTWLGRMGLKRRRGAHYNTRHHLFFFAPHVLVPLLRDRLGLRVLVVRGSLKPQRKPLTALLGRWFPSVDSGFLVLAQRPATPA
jgi:2-polyprenyl-3-methyl-5-hydroxy-6-metoxy-1,4-benzoquinol methylase